MYRAVTCAFCGRPVPAGTGLMYVKTDGSILYFCSSKCRKNLLKLRRNPAKIKWSKKTRRMYTR
ncbi:MAG: 50S ribosomal protein L24e [Thermoprotei archaeon]|nr:MAG: 50S ribosomal protein L24e [Thermoprotei archaeon]